MSYCNLELKVLNGFQPLGSIFFLGIRFGLQIISYSYNLKIQSQNIQYLIILSRFGQRKFHYFFPLLMPASTTAFMGQRYEFVDGLPKKHLMELKQIKQQFLISHERKVCNSPINLKPIYIQGKQTNVFTQIIKEQNFYKNLQICNYLKYIINRFDQKIILIYKKQQTKQMVSSLFSTKSSNNECQATKYINFTNAVHFQGDLVDKQSTILFLDSFKLEEQQLMRKIIQNLYKNNHRIQYCKFPFNPQQNYQIYPQYINMSQYIQIIDQQPQTLPLSHKKQILVYYDIHQPQIALEIHNQSDQVQEVKPITKQLKDNYIIEQKDIFKLNEKKTIKQLSIFTKQDSSSIDENFKIKYNQFNRINQKTMIKQFKQFIKHPQQKLKQKEQQIKSKRLKNQRKLKLKPIFKVNLISCCSHYP